VKTHIIHFIRKDDDVKMMCDSARERKREREKERETMSESERTKRENERKKEREREKKREREREREEERERKKERKRESQRETEREKEKERKRERKSTRVNNPSRSCTPNELSGPGNLEMCAVRDRFICVTSLMVGKFLLSHTASDAVIPT